MEDGREGLDVVVVVELAVPVTVVVVVTVVMTGVFGKEDVVESSGDEGKPAKAMLSTFNAFNVGFGFPPVVSVAATPVSGTSAVSPGGASSNDVSVATPVPVVTTWVPLTVYVVVPLSSVKSA